MPLVVRGPAGVPSGVSRFALVSEVDLAPTFAELAGVTLPLPPDGRSLVPLLGLLLRRREGWRQHALLRGVPARRR